MRLLLVDDDSRFRALLRTTFEAVEVDVDEAGSAAEAEQRISAVRPDVIVLDVGMPGMDGLAFCRELKESEDTSGIEATTRRRAPRPLRRLKGSSSPDRGRSF